MKITAKLFSLALVLLLLSCMSVTLYAEQTNVTATVVETNTPSYTIIVPDGITATDLQRTSTSVYYDKEFTVSIPESLPMNGKQICVRVYGDDGVFALKNATGDAVLPYEVFSNADAEQSLANGDIFATFVQVGEQTGFVRVDQKNITKADTYTGNLRFAFSVTDIEE